MAKKPSQTVWSQWQLQAKDIRKNLGVPMSLKPWSAREDEFLMTGLSKTNRILEILDLAVIDTLVAKHQGSSTDAIIELNRATSPRELKALMSDIYVDVSQNPVRKAWTNRNRVSKCLTTSTQLFSLARDRMILPIELLYLQGHTREVRIPSSMSQTSIRDLAGEGMHLACLGTLLYCLRITNMLEPSG